MKNVKILFFDRFSCSSVLSAQSAVKNSWKIRATPREQSRSRQTIYSGTNLTSFRATSPKLSGRDDELYRNSMGETARCAARAGSNG